MIQTFYKYGAMYAKAEPNHIQSVPIKLGDGEIYPGEYVSKLGEKKRSSFEMKEGHYLRYIGVGEDGKSKLILFAVDNHVHKENLYYAFYYINQNVLLCCSWRGCYDIRIKHLNKLTSRKGN